MRIDQLPDRRLRALAQAMRVASIDLGQLLDQMVDAPLSARMALYGQISSRVLSLQAQVRRWGIEHLPKFFDEADSKILKALGRANAPVGDITQGRAALRRLGMEFSEKVDQALFSIGATATRLLHTPNPVDALSGSRYAVRNAGIKARAQGSQAQKLRAQLRSHPVALLAKNGKVIHYALDYYVSAVASNSFTRAKNLPAEARAATTTGLVRVSSNPSMHGDYCDRYAGKVFSLSFSHPIFPPLASTPNGGAPFHPWCAHTVIPVLPGERVTADDAVSPDWLLAEGETDAKLVKKTTRPRR